ncbi:MAG: 50S ribosome-binding GTPase [Rhodoblastus sp.]|nr:MAG: 50S ribosome-binding GTPase [Rhodoblastus sp.]
MAAETEAQRRMALRQGDGRLRDRVESWADHLSMLLAQAEAELDFSDEDDVVVDLSVGLRAAKALALEMGQALADAARSDAMRDGFSVAIIGPPNAGKSSLLNRLVGHDAALVSDIPGTTRDAIEVRLDLDGTPARIIDTAGLRESSDPVEAMGIARARSAAARADMIMWLSVHEPPPPDVTALAIASQRDRFGTEALPAWAAGGVSIKSDELVSELLDRLRTAAQDGLNAGADLV